MAPAIQYIPIPTGREKQKTADIIGIITFMDFIEAAIVFCWSFGFVSGCGMSFVLSHCVSAEKIGMSRAPSISPK